MQSKKNQPISCAQSYGGGWETGQTVEKRFPTWRAARCCRCCICCLAPTCHSLASGRHAPRRTPGSEWSWPHRWCKQSVQHTHTYIYKAQNDEACRMYSLSTLPNSKGLGNKAHYPEVKNRGRKLSCNPGLQLAAHSDLSVAKKVLLSVLCLCWMCFKLF